MGTPSAVSDKNSQVLWQWEGEAFGDSKPQIEMVNQRLLTALFISILNQIKIDIVKEFDNMDKIMTYS